MYYKKPVLLLLMLTQLIGFSLLFCIQDARADFYETHAEGWHWYSEEEIQEEQKDAVKKEMSSNDPIEQMKAVKITIERALDKAILQPTDTNMKNYIVLQNRLGNQSSLFADVWQRVLLENPELNYSLVHPTNNLAKQADLDMQHKKEEIAIAKLAKESGLFFSIAPHALTVVNLHQYLKTFLQIITLLLFQ